MVIIALQIESRNSHGDSHKMKMKKLVYNKEKINKLIKNNQLKENYGTIIITHLVHSWRSSVQIQMI